MWVIAFTILAGWSTGASAQTRRSSWGLLFAVAVIAAPGLELWA